MDGFLMIALVSGVAVIIIIFGSRSSSSVSSASDVGYEPQTSNVISKVTLRTLLTPSPEACDADRTIIWNMQVPTLRFVSDHEPHGTPYAQLIPIYMELAPRYPEIYEGHNCEEWVECFAALELFRLAGKSIHITSRGHDFLAFLTEQCEPSLREPFSSSPLRKYTVNNNSAVPDL
jgi:hypothetical protein